MILCFWMDVISSRCIYLYALYIGYKKRTAEKARNKKWNFPATGYTPHWLASVEEIIKFEQTVKIIKVKTVIDIKILICFFIFIFMKLNKKWAAKKGIRIIPIKPRCPNQYAICSFSVEYITA